MSDLKKYAKYIIWILLFYLFTQLLIFIAFNSNYKTIKLRENLSEQISVQKAEATKSNVKIYGKIKNLETNNLNGKYIQVVVFDINDNRITDNYTKIENLELNEEKQFQISFSAKNAKSYEMNIVEKNKPEN